MKKIITKRILAGIMAIGLFFGNTLIGDALDEKSSETALESGLLMPYEMEESESQEPGVRENSFRYKDGEWVHDEISFYAEDFEPWTFSEGYWINSKGDPISGAIKKGIDVSYAQGKINWKAVKNSDVSFAIIRCGYGNNEEKQDDAAWKRNADECTRLGIPFGVYLYSYAMNKEEALSEAEHTLRLIEGYDLSLPVYLDLEDERYTGRLSNKEIADIAEVYCDTISAAGYDVGIYANLNWFRTKLTDSRFNQWPKWVAQYNYKCDYKGEYDIWQCTSTGRVKGIEGYVDLNFFMGSTPPEPPDIPDTEESESETETEPDMPEPERQVQEFVKRLYKLVLNRGADAEGLQEWKDILLDQKETGAEVARGFVFSEEFIKRETNDDEFLDILYETFLNRSSDEAGKASWNVRLDQGFSREYILKGFIESQEFDQICSEYGILRGNIFLNNIQDQNPEITKYLARCYEVFLNRKPDQKGMVSWVEAFVIRKEDPQTITKGFVFSDEMKKKNLSNEEYIKILYKGLFDRNADSIGLKDWMKWFQDGKSREEVFWGFANSDEFYRLVKSFGL